MPDVMPDPPMNDQPTHKNEETNRLSPAAEIADFSAPERESIERRSRPSAALIHETIRVEGLSELDRPVASLLLSGLAAGLSMGFSLLSESLLRGRLPEAHWAELVSRLGYAVGFLIVVLGRQQLFTENTLTPVLPLLHERKARILGGLMRLWGLVLTANIVGAGCIALALASSGILDASSASAAQAIAHEAFSHSPPQLLVRGIFAGWLIALMVWLLPSAEGSRPAIILMVTYIVALGGFSHVIAGSVDVLYLHFLGEVSWMDYALRFLLPTLAGNVAGGVTLVAALNYGQVASEIEA